jgi:hypothetical protein
MLTTQEIGDRQSLELGCREGANGNRSRLLICARREISVRSKVANDLTSRPTKTRRNPA